MKGMRRKYFGLMMVLTGLILALAVAPAATKTAGDLGEFSCSDYVLTPPFLTASAPPLVMLVMGRDHKLYYEAYNDASDIDGDGVLDVGYNPDIDYYGYFDSSKYYEYDSTNDLFVPAGVTNDKTAPSGEYWSGDFLNYLTMSRMDCLRKVLYGGKRSTDTASATVLERAYIPQDAHSWGKEYSYWDTYDISDYTPLSDFSGSGSRHLFASTTLSEDGDPLLRILESSPHRIWNWVSKESPVADDSLGTPDREYVVRVKVGDPSFPEEDCKLYPGATNATDDDVYKPVGVLQKFGEAGRIKFGLITGSYVKNMSGGVLRRNIGDISNEFNNATGVFDTTVNGIVSTLNKLQIYGYDDTIDGYDTDWSRIRPMQEGETPDWGNPVGEMMYEALNYFSGGTYTSEFN